MLMRRARAEPKPLKGGNTAADADNRAVPRADACGVGSVIGHEVTIIGQGLNIISRGTLRLDGEIAGNVQGRDVIVGAQAEVIGTITALNVTIAGKVCGAIYAEVVTLEASSQVVGDIHHLSLAVKEGAEFRGRSRPAAYAQASADLRATREGVAADRATVRPGAIGNVSRWPSRRVYTGLARDAMG
jgi:cytoskeletal protein CcmA (bactofilin family)